MTEQIKILESFKETFIGTDNINAIDVAISALEKQIPKKPILMKFDHYDSYFCKCGLGFGNSIMMIRPQYCNNCGQKLDWRDTE